MVAVPVPRSVRRGDGDSRPPQVSVIGLASVAGGHGVGAVDQRGFQLAKMPSELWCQTHAYGA